MRIRPIRRRRVWLGGPLLKDALRELELALRPSELDQLLRVGLGGLPWKNQGCSLMLLVLLLAGGAATLAGLDAGRRVLERLAEAHLKNPRLAAVRAEKREQIELKFDSERALPAGEREERRLALNEPPPDGDRSGE